jgi:hypothetical protein
MLSLVPSGFAVPVHHTLPAVQLVYGCSTWLDVILRLAQVKRHNISRGR